MDLTSMSVAELQQELQRCEADADLLGTSQQVKKILLNSLD